MLLVPGTRYFLPGSMLMGTAVSQLTEKCLHHSSGCISWGTWNNMFCCQPGLRYEREQYQVSQALFYTPIQDLNLAENSTKYFLLSGVVNHFCESFLHNSW